MWLTGLRRHLHRPLGYLAKITDLPVAYRVMDALVSADDARSNQDMIRESLQMIFPDKNEEWVDDTVRHIIRHYNWAYLDSLILPILSESEIDQVFEVEGSELIGKALTRGRGVVLYGIHYGRFWGAPIYPCKKGYTLSYIARTRGLAAAFHTNRCITGKMINVDDFDKQEVYQVLQRNELLMTMADGSVGRKPVTVNFLGHPAHFSPSFIVFAREAGTPLIGWMTYSISRERIGLRFFEADADPEAPLGEQMQMLLAPLIERVREDPGQWFSARRVARGGIRHPQASD